MRALGAMAACAALSLSLAEGANLRQTETDLQALREQLATAAKAAARASQQQDRLTRSLRDAELAVAEARGELARLQSERRQHAQQQTKLEAERATEQRRLSNEQEALAGQLRVAYLIRRNEPLKLLLNREDPLRTSRMMAYYGYFGRERARQVATIEARLKNLVELESALQQEASSLRRVQQQAERALADLEERRGARARVLSAQQTEVRQRNSRLAQLKNQQAELEKILSELKRALRSVPPAEVGTAFSGLRGRLDWPVDGRVVARYGESRVASVKWEGVVVATERGATVRAVAAGRVIFAQWTAAVGMLAIVDHGNDYWTLYGYNDRLVRQEGDAVKAGEEIAAAGDSGGRSRPELYFELRRAGRPQDPLPWFRRATP